MSKLYVDQIYPKTTGGTITVNSSVVSTERPSFFATSTDTGYGTLANGDYFAGSSWWNDVHHNTGNHFNASTGTFTAPVNGVYFFSFSVLNDSAQSFALQLHKNGSLLLRPYIETNRAMQFSVNLYLVTNDEIRVAAQTGDNYRFGSAYTWFSGCLIG